MLYTTFIRLCNEALNHDDCQEFIMSLGWQSWMDKAADVEEVVQDLSLIFELGGLDFAGLRARLGISMARMAELYRIPLRTIENWDCKKSSNSRDIAPYIIDFIRFSIFVREKEGDDGYLCDLT